MLNPKALRFSLTLNRKYKIDKKTSKLAELYLSRDYLIHKRLCGFEIHTNLSFKLRSTEKKKTSSFTFNQPRSNNKQTTIKTFNAEKQNPFPPHVLFLSLNYKI